MSIFIERDKATIANIIRRGGRQELLDVISKIGENEKYCAKCDTFYHIDEFRTKKDKTFNSYDYCTKCRSDYGKDYKDNQKAIQKDKLERKWDRLT